jgi:hypothetical protein
MEQKASSFQRTVTRDERLIEGGESPAIESFQALRFARVGTMVFFQGGHLATKTDSTTVSDDIIRKKRKGSRLNTERCSEMHFENVGAF